MTTPTSERVGVLGGTFDPIHVAHLAMAAQAKHQLRLDRVLFVVANVPWQKTGKRSITPAGLRFEMVRSATEGYPGFEASRIEIDRGGDSYTADTLAQLARPGRELFLLIGSDLVAQLTTWKRWEEIPALCTLAVTYRPSEVAAGELAPGWRSCEVRLPAIELSSTELRAMVAEGRPIDFLVPDVVARAIVSNRLYQPRPVTR